MKTEKARIIEETGQKYNEIIFEDDYIPKEVYLHQIRLRNAVIDRLLAGKKFKYAIDMGSGTGFHLRTLSKYSENLIATDFSMGALKDSKKRFDCQFVVCDINRLPFKPGTIDFIWVAGVLHHVPKDLDNVIGYNLSPILRKDGLMLIDEPNKLNLLNYANMKLSKADPTGDERPLSQRTIGRLLDKYGLTVVDSDHYELFQPIGVYLNNKTLTKLFGGIDRIINRTFFKAISIRWYIFAKKD